MLVKIYSINKRNQIEINMQKEKFDSLHIEYIILLNEHDRFNYSLEYIGEKYPKVLDEFIEFYETQTE
jgi:hypothetical protein